MENTNLTWIINTQSSGNFKNRSKKYSLLLNKKISILIK